MLTWEGIHGCTAMTTYETGSSSKTVTFMPSWIPSYVQKHADARIKSPPSVSNFLLQG